MRKAFDANVPKLKPRLKLGAQAAAPATAFAVARMRSKISSCTASMSVAPFESGS